MTTPLERRHCTEYPEDSPYNCVDHPTYGSVCENCHVRLLLDVAEAAQEAQRFADNEKHCRHAREDAEPGNGGDAAIALCNAIAFREAADRALKVALGKITTKGPVPYISSDEMQGGE